MKKIDFNNKKTTWWLISILILIVIAIIISKKVQNNPVNNNASNSNLVDIVNIDNYSKYEGTVSTQFEGERSVDFSFLYQNGTLVAKGNCGSTQCFTLTNASSTNNVTLYFTYEGGRGLTVSDYADILLKDNASGTVEDLKFAAEASSSVKYIVNTDTGYAYYVEAVTGKDGDPWLAIVENKNGADITAQTEAKDLIRSLKFTNSTSTQE